MAIPEYPMTRREQYLESIATNDTSGLPAEPITRTEQYLDAIARNGGGGGSSLPDVTADDNGDVLTVVEGAWGKAAPSGSSGVLVVHDDNGALDKTWKEISTAATSGVVVWVAGDPTDLTVFNLTSTYAEDGEYGVVFMDVSEGGLHFRMFATDNEDGYPVVQQDGGGD